MPNGNYQKRKAERNNSIEKKRDKAAKIPKKVCVFCLSAEQDDLQLGEVLTKNDLTCHYFCLLLASGLYQNGRPSEKSSIRGFLLNDIQNETRRGLRLRCFYCHEKGATLGCCGKKCKKTFHLPCGRANGSLHQFFGGFGSFCDEHRPKQSLKSCDDCQNFDDVSCNICLCPLNEESSSVNVLHSPCCNNSWFHRSCIQQYAISAGKHHFRCPMCNCGKGFLSEMETLGIYIPDQDASWERQSGAYNELLERHNRCDADICSCPSGRNYDAESGKYDLLLCACCGSFGSHRTCRGLVWQDSSLVCPICASITKQFVEPERKARLKNSLTSDSGSSSCRSSNSQLPSNSLSSSAIQEKVIHIEMADSGEDVDVDDGDIHVPPFLYNSMRTKVFQNKSLPSCSILLQKIDEVLPLSQNAINLKKITGFSYNKRKGYLLKKKVCVKHGGKVLSKNVESESDEKMYGIIHKPECQKQKKSTFIKQYDFRSEAFVQKIICSKNLKQFGKKKKLGKKNKKNNIFTPKRRIKKIHTSPLTSVKKQKALKFLMSFNRNSQKQCRRKRKTNSPIDLSIDTSPSNEKKLVQSTLNFIKSPTLMTSLSKSDFEDTEDKLKIKTPSTCTKQGVQGDLVNTAKGTLLKSQYDELTSLKKTQSTPAPKINNLTEDKKEKLSSPTRTRTTPTKCGRKWDEAAMMTLGKSQSENAKGTLPKSHYDKLTSPKKSQSTPTKQGIKKDLHEPAMNTLTKSLTEDKKEKQSSPTKTCSSPTKRGRKGNEAAIMTSAKSQFEDAKVKIQIKTHSTHTKQVMDTLPKSYEVVKDKLLSPIENLSSPTKEKIKRDSDDSKVGSQFETINDKMSSPAKTLTPTKRVRGNEKSRDNDRLIHGERVGNNNLVLASTCSSLSADEFESGPTLHRNLRTTHNTKIRIDDDGNKFKRANKELPKAVVFSQLKALRFVCRGYLDR